MEEVESQAAVTLKKLISKNELELELAFITSSFRNLSNNLTKLEGRVSPSQSVAVVEEILVGLGTESLSPYKVKLEAVLKQNPD